MYIYQQLSPEISPLISKYFSSERISIQYFSAGLKSGSCRSEPRSPARGRCCGVRGKREEIVTSGQVCAGAACLRAADCQQF